MSGQESSGALCVAVFAAPDEPASLAEVLERALGMHPIDAIARARDAPGIVATGLAREAADNLVAAIAESGLHAEAVDAGTIPNLEHAEVVHHARCLKAGFEIVGLDGERELLIPWEQLDLVSIGLVPRETSRRSVAGDMTVIRSARRTGPSTIEVPLSPSLEAWLVCRNPARVYRVDDKRMNYEYLGPRKTDSGSANFRMFLDDVIARAPGIYLTPATRAYAEHASVHEYSFDSPEALERETLLHVLIRRSARKSSGEGAT